MKIKLLLAIALFFGFTSARADWAPNLWITAVTPYSGGLVDISISSPPSSTCQFYGSTFRFDSNASGGKQIYAVILTAKALNKQVNISYNVSTTPGKDQSNGCTATTMAKLWAVTIP